MSASKRKFKKTALDNHNFSRQLVKFEDGNIYLFTLLISSYEYFFRRLVTPIGRYFLVTVRVFLQFLKEHFSFEKICLTLLRVIAACIIPLLFISLYQLITTK